MTPAEVAALRERLAYLADTYAFSVAQSDCVPVPERLVRAALALLDAQAETIARLTAERAWRPIETLKCNWSGVLLGRWCCGPRPAGYWQWVHGGWFEIGGEKHWTYEEKDRPSPFYDDDGNYAEPTHWALLPLAPAPAAEVE